MQKRETKNERERDTQRDRQRERQTETQRESQREKERERERERHVAISKGYPWTPTWSLRFLGLEWATRVQVLRSTGPYLT